MQHASNYLKFYDFSTPANHLKNIDLPDIGSVLSTSGKHDLKEFFYKFGSFTDPGSAWRVDMDTFAMTKIGETKLQDDSINISDFTTS